MAWLRVVQDCPDRQMMPGRHGSLETKERAMVHLEKLFRSRVAMAFATIGSLTAGLVAMPLALAAQEAIPGPSDAIPPVHWRLTAVTGIAIGPDGALYAVQMSTGNTETAPFYRPNSGNVVRQIGPDSFEEIATGLDYPVHLGFGPDGA